MNTYKSTIFAIFIVILLLNVKTMSAQTLKQYNGGDSNKYVGTWVYQNNDTIFRIKLQLGIEYSSDTSIYGDEPVLFGNYCLEVGGVVKENNFGYIPYRWDTSSNKPEKLTISLHFIYTLDAINNIYRAVKENELLIWFWDQERKFNGKDEARVCGKVHYISPTQIRWELDENFWLELFGYDEEYRVGFSVPTDVIMTKEEKD